MSSKWELNEGDSTPSEQETLPPSTENEGEYAKTHSNPPTKKRGGKKKKTEGLEGWTEPEPYEHWIGMYGVLPPASLQYDGEGKLLADAQTYPELLRKKIRENREKEQKERKRREDEGLTEERW
eukprot:g6750.t1